MIPSALLKPILSSVKSQLGTVNNFIVTELSKQVVDKEAGEYATFIILSSKNGESFLLPAVMDKDDKVIRHGSKEKVTDFLTKIIEFYMALNDDLDLEDYNFSDGDLSSFTSEFSRPKQDMGISEEVTEDDDYFANEEPMGVEGEEPAGGGLSLGTVVSMAQARNVSKGLTVGADALMSGFMGMFNNGDSSPFKLTTDEKEQVVTSLAVVLKHNNATVSPTWGLIITVLTIYAGKAMILHQLRADRKKQNSLNTENELLKAKLSKLKKNAGRENSENGDIARA